MAEPRWVTARTLRCRKRVTMAQAKKQWRRIDRYLLTRESRRAMARPKWRVVDGRPTVASRDGKEQYVATCYNGWVTFAVSFVEPSRAVVGRPAGEVAAVDAI